MCMCGGVVGWGESSQEKVQLAVPTRQTLHTHNPAV